MYRLIFTLLLCVFTQGLFAQIWQDVDESQFSSKGERVIQAQKYRSLALDEMQLRQQLALAPMEGSIKVEQSPVQLEFPMPDGRIVHFNVVESPVMAPQLAAKYPGIKTYAGKGVEDPTAIIRFDLSQKGFHAMVSSVEGSIFIDPYFRNNDGNYIAYHKKDFTTDKQFTCEVEDDLKGATDLADKGILAPVGDELRTYRLAISTTVSYSAYHGGNKPDVLAAVVTSVNRINEIYIRDFSVKLELIANQDTLIYLTAAESPFSGGGSTTYLGENQTNIDAVIGTANYDMGHVYDRGGGGVAQLASVCSSTRKAQGYTSNDPPVNDPFDIDYVAHEMGHQFNGNHTFNDCSGGQGAAAYEPGSAITIMGYAGLCGANDLSNNSIAMFHTGNFNEMSSFTLTGGGNNCPVITANGNTPPTVDAGDSGYIIPISTPFELTGAAMDPDGDSLTYCWEQHDLGPSGSPNSPTGNAPLFRSFLPVNTPTRVFPKIQDILFDVQSIGEILPDYARDMSFRLTVRDNNLTGGGSDYEEMTMSVSDLAGPFRVTSQGSSTTWLVGQNALVEWDVANTDQAPVNCTSVDIFMSIDNGFTYPITLATAVPNDGSQTITVPANAGFGRYVKVKASNNVFFHINQSPIIIEEPTVPDFTMNSFTDSQLICGVGSATYDLDFSSLLGFNEPVTLSISGNPAGTTASFTNNPFTPPGTNTMTIDHDGMATGTYTVTVTGTSASSTKTTEVQLTVFSGSPVTINLVNPVDAAIAASVLPIFEWVADPNATAYNLDLATDPAFMNVIHSQTGIIGTTYSSPNDLEAESLFYWRVMGTNADCGDGPFNSQSFTTEAIECSSFAATDLPINIPTSTAVITSMLTVPDSAIIRDLNVLNLVGTHTWINDLDFVLTSPAGTSVQIIAQSCDDEDDFDINLDDEVTNAVFPCPYNNGQTYQPSSPLSTFDGEQMAGDWELQVTDNVNQDGGELEGWMLEFCYTAPDTTVAIGDIPSSLSAVRIYPNPAKDQVTMQIDLEKASSANVIITNAAGQVMLRQEAQQFSVGQNLLVVDTKNFPAGVYFYQVLEEKNKGFKTGKLMIYR